MYKFIVSDPVHAFCRYDEKLSIHEKEKKKSNCSDKRKPKDNIRELILSPIHAYNYPIQDN